MKNVFLLMLSLLLLSSCTFLNNNSISKSEGELRFIRAEYINQSADSASTDTSKSIVYGESFDLLKNIQVYAFYMGGISKPLTYGEYTVKTTYNVNTTYDELLTYYQAGNYKFTFSYQNSTDYLYLEVNKADLYGVDVKFPKIGYLEKFGEIEISNLPENEQFDITFEYRLTSIAGSQYVLWDFNPEEINTIFTPSDIIGFRLTIESNNYNKFQIEESSNIEKYSLKNDLIISTDTLSFTFIPSKNGSNAILDDYNSLLEKNLKAYYNEELIEGKFQFVDGNKSIEHIGKYDGLDVVFSVAYNKLYVSEDIYFTINVNITPFAIEYPRLKNFNYFLRSDFVYNPSYSYSHITANYEQDFYNLYYVDRDLVVLNGDGHIYPGTYECEVSLYDNLNTIWIDNTTSSYIDTWAINPHTFSLETIIIGYIKDKDDSTYFYGEFNNDKTIIIYRENTTFLFFERYHDYNQNENIVRPLAGYIMHEVKLDKESQQYAQIDFKMELTINSDAPKNTDGAVEIKLTFVITEPYCVITPNNIKFTILAYF